MFEFGFSELLMIGLVALVVLGPERLPVVARTAGLWLGRVRTYVDSVKAEINQQVEASELKEVKESLQEAAQSLQESMHDLEQSAQREWESVSEELDVRPAWERLPEQRTPADFGVDNQGQPLYRHDDGQTPAFRDPDFWGGRSDCLHMVSLNRQAVARRRDMRPKYRAKPKLRARRYR